MMKMKTQSYNSALKISLNLFSPTFKRLPHTAAIISNLKEKVKNNFDMDTLDLTARLLYANKLISQQTAQLQQDKTLEVLSHFDQFYAEFKFDYEKGKFNLVRQIKHRQDLARKKFVFQVDAINIEHFDHPFMRQKLYFHELKDLDKYGEIQFGPGAPKFWKNMERKQIQNQVLDSNNPLGVPHWAEQLKINIQAHQKQMICGFDIAAKLGQIKLNGLYHKKHNYTFNLDTMNISQRTQEMIFVFLKSRAGLTLEQIEKISKLAFIGGRVNKLQLMMNLVEEISNSIQ